MHLERAQGVFVVRRDEYHQWQVIRRDALHDLEAALPGHLHVEQDYIWPQRANRLHGSGALAGFAHDVHIWHCPEHQPQTIARQRLVIHDKRAHAGSHASRYGTTMPTAAPPCSPGPIVTVCASP